MTPNVSLLIEKLFEHGYLEDRPRFKWRRFVKDTPYGLILVKIRPSMCMIVRLSNRLMESWRKEGV